MNELFRNFTFTYLSYQNEFIPTLINKEYKFYIGK